MKDKEIKVLEELKKGKSIKEAANTASTLEILVKRWIRLGEEGDEDYKEFYEEYKKISLGNQETKNDTEDIIDKCVKLLESGVHFREIPNLLDVSESELKNFFTQGRLGVKPYNKYYEASVQSKKSLKNFKKEKNNISNRLHNLSLKELDFILEENNCLQIIPNKNRKIRTIKEEISTEDIKKSLTKLNHAKKIEKKIERQLNKLKMRTLLGYLDETDRVLYNNRPRKKIIQKIIKDLKFNEMEDFYNKLFGIKKPKSEEKSISNEEIIKGEEGRVGINPKDGETKNIKTGKETHIGKENLEKDSKNRCEICGRELNPYTKRDKCKRCLRSIHGVNILNELLNYIQPGIPFIKDDLKNLGYHKDKAQFSIWVLLDNNLLKKEPNKKYSLVEKEKLDAFIEKWGEYIENPDGRIDSTVILSKECIICKNTFSISNFDKSPSSIDGFKDYCKKCKPLVNAARALKNLLNYVKPKEVFYKYELYQYYEQPFLLDTSIFNLIDHNLIQQKGDKYRLKDEEILNDFLDKYYIEEEPRAIEDEGEIVEESASAEQISTPSEEDIELKRKMNIVLHYLKEGFSEKEAFNSADLNKSILITWKNLGRRGQEPYDYFYQEYKKLKNEEDPIEESIVNEPKKELSEEERRIKEQMNLFTKEIINTQSIKDAFKNANLNKEEFSQWIILGDNGEELYKNFLDIYKNNIKYIINEEIKTIRIEEAKRLMVQGYSVDEAIERANKIDYTKKEEELNQIIEIEHNQLIQGIEEDTKTYLNDLNNELSFELISQNEKTGLSTVIIRGKIKDDNLIPIFDKLRDYQRNFNKILTNRINDDEYDVFIELEIKEEEMEQIDLLNI